MNQSSFADTIHLIEIQPPSDLNRLVSGEEKHELRSVVGQLNWLSGVSGPDLSLDVCKIVLSKED